MTVYDIFKHLHNQDIPTKVGSVSIIHNHYQRKLKLRSIEIDVGGGGTIFGAGLVSEGH